MKKLMSRLLLGATIVGSASSAYALPTELTLFLWSGGTTVTVHDDGPGDLSTTDAKINFDGPVGANWTANTDVGTSKPLTGTATAPYMDITFNQLSSLGGGTLSVALWDNGFGPTAGNALASLGGTFKDNGSTVTYNTYYSASQVEPVFVAGVLDLTGFVLLTSQTINSPPSGGFSDDTGGGPISGGNNPYSLLQVVTVTHTVKSQTTGDAVISSVPDGGTTLMLLGSGLAALGFFRRSFNSAKA